ncbi:MAG: hypothetical protein ACE5HA_00455 [Anaerolineae bacterium]
MRPRSLLFTKIVLSFLTLASVTCSSPTATPTSTPPTWTLVPTADLSAVQTAAAATVMAQIASDLTATAAALPTETPIPTSTKTTQPTATLAPTRPPTATATATRTQTVAPSATLPPVPTSIPRPAISLDLTDMRYEQWGRPVEGCRRFDNGSPVRKFNLEITLTNHSTQAVKDWYPDFYANTGRLLLTCYYIYGEGFPPVPPDEARTVTFASFTEQGEFVQEMRVNVLGRDYRRCFTPEGASTPCS